MAMMGFSAKKMVFWQARYRMPEYTVAASWRRLRSAPATVPNPHSCPCPGPLACGAACCCGMWWLDRWVPPPSLSTDPGEFPGDLGRSWACDSNKYDVFSCPPCGQGQPIRKQRHFLGQMFYPSVSVWTRLHLFFYLGNLHVHTRTTKKQFFFFFVEIICTREQIIQ